MILLATITIPHTAHLNLTNLSKRKQLYMARDNHQWIPGAEPPEIRPHSQAKHRVIDAYLRRYVEVLTGDVRIPEFYLTLVDGFSGGGI